MREPDELCQRRIKNAERVRKIDTLPDRDVVPVSETDRSAREVAKAIDGNASRFLKFRNKKR